jgi:2-hydroxy-6-oxonona-2,4-dienedioate hydrolase
MNLTFWTSLMKVPFRLGYVQAGGVPTRYLEAGEGPALVLIHGAGAHLEVFLPVVPLLAQGRRVIAYDMVGHGLSAKPPVDYTTEVLSTHLLDLLSALELPRASLLGHSLGALVAAWTAAYRPERVDRLVLVTPGSVADDPEVLKRIREGTLRALERLEQDAIRERLVWLFQRPEALTEELIALRLSIYRLPEYREAALRALVMQDPEVRRRFGWREEWARRMTKPIFLLWSQKDPGTPAEGLHLLRKWWPQMAETELEGVGHFPMLEDPKWFAQAVRSFLE